MSYQIHEIKQLKDLIENRTYVHGLEIFINDNINHLLKLFVDLKTLEFYNKFIDYEIDFSKLVKLEVLIFHIRHGYDQPTDLSNLENLEWLHLGYSYNQKTIFPTSGKLKHLSIHGNAEIDCSNFPNLTYLEFSGMYNQPTDFSKCEKLECLMFGDDYDQPTDFPALKQLKSVNFGKSFNQKIDVSLLVGLEQLKFDCAYTHSVDTSKCPKFGKIKCDQKDHDW